MAAKSSDLDGLKAVVTIQMEGHTLTPPSGQKGPEETVVSESTPSHSPSQSPVRKLMPDCHETWYCLGIQVIMTEEGGATPPPPHAWQVPVVEDMLCDGRSSLTKVIVMGLSWAVLFYGRQILGEHLSLGEVRDAMFMLSGTISCVGKQALLNANPLSLQEGQWLIAQAITEQCIIARGPGHPHSHLPVILPLWFHCRDESPLEERFHSANKLIEEPGCICQPSHHDRGRVQQCSHSHGHQQWDPWVVQPPTWSPSPDDRFKSGRGSVSTSSSVSSRSNRLGGSMLWHHGQCCRELGGPLKINRPVFKDEDTKWCSHIWKLALGFDSVSPCWVLRSHPSPLCHLLPKRFPWRVGGEFGDSHHLSWCAYHTRWTLH